MAKFPRTRRDEYKERKQKNLIDGRPAIYKPKTRFQSRISEGGQSDKADGVQNAESDAEIDLPCSSTTTTSAGIERNKTDDKIPTFGCWSKTVVIAAVFLFYFDLTTDIVLAEQYFRYGKWLEFSLTTLFIVGPSVVICIFGLYWYWQDKKHFNDDDNNISQVDEDDDDDKDNYKYASRCLWFCRFLFTSLCMGPVMRSIEYFYRGCKSETEKLHKEERKWHYKQMLLDDIDTTLLRVFDCFLECAPQLLLQMYIIGTEKPQDHIFLDIIRYIGLLSSWYWFDSGIQRGVSSDPKSPPGLISKQVVNLRSRTMRLESPQHITHPI
ncbi:hypothetical protein ScPMuIL_000601 [Solemya velum]